MEQLIVSRLRKEYHRAICCHSVYAENIMRNAGLDALQAGIKIGRRNINNLRYADDTTLMAESKEELKSLLLRWRRTVKMLASCGGFILIFGKTNTVM